MAEEKRNLGDFDSERFEELKARFVAATSAKERRRIFGELMNDCVRDQFKKWVPDRRHASSVVQDYFISILIDFDPEKFVPSEERDRNKKKKVAFFDEFANLDHFIAYSRRRLGWIFCARVKRGANAATTVETPEAAVENSELAEIIEQEHVDYILKCFQTEFEEKEYFIFAMRALEKWSYPKIAEQWRARRNEEINADQARAIYHKVEKRCLRIWGCCMQGRYYTQRFDKNRRADLGKLNDGDDEFTSGSLVKI